MDFKHYAIQFCRVLQRIEKGDEISLDDIKLIRQFKTDLGYNIPESLEQGSGAMVRKPKTDDNYLEKILIKYSRNNK